MTSIRARNDALIDRFVAEVGLLGSEVELADDESQGFPLAGAGNRVIRPRSTSWIPTLEQRIGQAFPPSFRSLVTRYEFAPFEAGELMLFGNTDRGGTFDLADAIFKDGAIFTATNQAGLLQFGHPYWYNYDPVCFDTRQRSREGECPIVQVDHEEILCNDRIKVVAELFPSFLDYAERVVNERLVSKYLRERRGQG